MTPEERRIYKTLKKNDGHAYVAPDGKNMYALVDGGMIHFVTSLNFNTMSAAEVNQFIQTALAEM